MNEWILIAILSAISGAFYWCGGRGGGPWYLNSKMRDIPCSLITVGLAMYLIRDGSWQHFLHFAFLWAALTTYWKKITKLWKDDNKLRHTNWALTGFFYGLSSLPLLFTDLGWYLVVGRIVALTILTTGFGLFFRSNIHISEFGRGFVLVATIVIYVL
jgi:hypothetical protein